MSSSLSQVAESNITAKPARLYYVDWLRVFAMVGIFFFHNARFYDVFGDWHVKNASTNFGASALIGFMDPWIMPLFFLIAGAGTYYSLKSRRVRQFIQERSLRLLIPLIFGMFIIVMPQAYFEAVSHGELTGTSFFGYYPEYLTTLSELNWFHLWFLAYLFVFSLVALPVFRPFGKAAKSVIARAAAVLNKSWTLLPLLVLSIAGIDMLITPTGFWGNRDHGGWSILSYALFFILGYLLFSDTRLLEIVKRLRWYFLGAGIILSGLLFVFFVDPLAEPGNYFGTASYNLAHLFRSMNSWAWMLAFIGIAARFLNFNNRFLTYASEAVLPFYVLHQTVIISIGFFVVQWSMSIPLKYLIISTSSFAAIMAIYEVLVRRINVLRFLFGMRLKKKPKVTQQPN